LIEVFNVCGIELYSSLEIKFTELPVSMRAATVFEYNLTGKYKYFEFSPCITVSSSEQLSVEKSFILLFTKLQDSCCIMGEGFLSVAVFSGEGLRILALAVLQRERAVWPPGSGGFPDYLMN
jgi:hypothetical protein